MEFGEKVSFLLLQMEHLINPHNPDPVSQACADCQYGADVKQLGELRGKGKSYERGK